MAFQSLNDFYREAKESYSPEKQERAFRGLWIPREIWFAKDLSYPEKMLWAEINSLDTEKKGCHASNKYLAKFFKLTERQVREHISKLKKKGYIYQASFDGRKRVLRSSLKYKKERKTERKKTA